MCVCVRGKEREMERGGGTVGWVGGRGEDTQKGGRKDRGGERGGGREAGERKKQKETDRDRQ